MLLINDILFQYSFETLKRQKTRRKVLRLPDTCLTAVKQSLIRSLSED